VQVYTDCLFQSFKELVSSAITGTLGNSGTTINYNDRFEPLRIFGFCCEHECLCMIYSSARGKMMITRSLLSHREKLSFAHVGRLL
jgi:hypothetical protein